MSPNEQTYPNFILNSQYVQQKAALGKTIEKQTLNNHKSALDALRHSTKVSACVLRYRVSTGCVEPVGAVHPLPTYSWPPLPATHELPLFGIMAFRRGSTRYRYALLQHQADVIGRALDSTYEPRFWALPSGGSVDLGFMPFGACAIMGAVSRVGNGGS